MQHWKCCVVQATRGSNPRLSAKTCRKALVMQGLSGVFTGILHVIYILLIDSETEMCNSNVVYEFNDMSD